MEKGHEDGVEWPQPPVEVHNHHMDSTIWRDINFRDDDIVVSSWAKSGTTLTQQLIGQLISGGDPDFPQAMDTPWLELRVMPRSDTIAALDAQTHRRIIKTHLPTEALPYNPNVKYIYCVRDGRDTCWSMHNHHCQGNDMWYDMINSTPGRVGPPLPRPDPDPRAYFASWLAGDGAPFWPYWPNVRAWWRARKLPNVLLVHFNNLRADLRGEAARIADFLGITVPEDRWPSILEHCSMDWMRSHLGTAVHPGIQGIFRDGVAGFVFKGTNGRWRDTLTAEDVAEYEATARRELGDAAAAYLASGSPADVKVV